MPRIRLYRVSALVLRSRELGECDRIVTLLTKERGKLSAVAKGVKRPLSKLAAGLQPFTHSRLQLAEGQNLDVVTQCQIVQSFYRLREDLSRVAYASYFAELVDELVEERGRSGGIFALLVSALGRLEAGTDPSLLARSFELRMMAICGYRPELDRCQSCGRSLDQAAEAGFSSELGGAVCRDCAEVTPSARPICGGTLQAARRLARAAPEQVARLRLSPQILNELESALHGYLEYHLERSLRTTRFIREFRG